MFSNRFPNNFLNNFFNNFLNNFKEDFGTAEVFLKYNKGGTADDIFKH